MQAMWKSDVSQANRLWSPGVWGDMVRPDGLNFEGRLFHDDFVSNGPIGTSSAQIGGYQFFTESSGTLTDAGIDGGVLLLSANTTDDKSVSLAGAVGGGIMGFGYGDFAFEARIKNSSIAALTGSIFVGLMESQVLASAVPITAGDALANKDMVGFFRSAGGATMDTTYKRTGQTVRVVGTAKTTLVADTFIKLGIRYNANDQTVRFFVDGIELADKVKLVALNRTYSDGYYFPCNDGTNFVKPLVPVIAKMNSTGYSSLYLDWWTVGIKEVAA